MDLQTFHAATQRTSGMAEVSARWAAEHRGAFRFVDVRQPHELEGPLGAAEGVENVPLDQLLTQVGRWDRETPTVLICRSGRRSGIAVAAFEAEGYRNLASVEGGTLAWNTEVLGKGDIHLSERKTSAATLREATYTTNGLPEVSPDWVHAHLGLVRFVDVREPAELVGELGQVLQAVNVPLATVAQGVAGWARDEPVVITCKAGGRAARALATMQQLGFEHVASMEGGMLGWHAAGLPVAPR